MNCVNCKKGVHVVYGMLRSGYWCQMCAATYVIKEIKTHLSAAVAKEADARPLNTLPPTFRKQQGP